jgi:pteridine reductase
MQGILKNAALVTGGAKRLGAGIALDLARSGWDIALHYNSSGKEAEESCDQIRSLGRSCSLFGGDLRDEKFLTELMTAAFSDFPHLNLLVNSASSFIRSDIGHTNAKIFDELVSVNFRAPFLLTKEFARFCKKGNIINIIDTKISNVQTAYSAYILSRSAVSGLTRLAAAEFSPGIRCNAICPGFILPADTDSDEYIKKLEARNYLEKRGSVKNITSAVKFLIENDFVTGEVIYVDGGENLKQV